MVPNLLNVMTMTSHISQSAGEYGREALETRPSLKCIQATHMGEEDPEACCDGGDVLFTGVGAGEGGSDMRD